MKTKNMIVMLAVAYLALGLSATATNTWVATTDTNEVKVEVELNAIDEEANLVEAVAKMVRISTKEASKFSAEMAAIQALVASGELSEEEGKAKGEALEAEFEARMEAYGESMEAWGESFGARMEKWGENLGKEIEAEMAEDVEGEIRIEMKQLKEELAELDEEFSGIEPVEDDSDEPKKSDKTKEDYFEWSIGGNSFLSSPDVQNGVNFAAVGGDLMPWESVNFRFGFGSKYKVGGAGSPVVLQWGLGMESNTYSFSHDEVLTKITDLNGNTVTDFAPVDGMNDVRNNAFYLTYLEMPVMLHFDLSPRGKFDKGLTFGIGGYGGIRLDSYTMIRGRDVEAQRYIVRNQNNLNTQLLRYGLQGQLGYKAFKVTGRVDAAPLFQPNTFNEDAYIASVGIGYCW